MSRFARLPLALALAGASALALAQQLPKPEPLGEPASTVYRQVMPDGSIVYSDKPVKGAKIDETISADPATNIWDLDTGKPAAAPPRNERTPVVKVIVIPKPGQTKTLENANAEVIRAEMLLDDARKRQEQGVEPLAGERTGIVSGGTRLNESYHARQRFLAEEVAEAEAALRSAVAERNTLRRSASR